MDGEIHSLASSFDPETGLYLTGTRSGFAQAHQHASLAAVTIFDTIVVKSELDRNRGLARAMVEDILGMAAHRATELVVVDTGSMDDIDLVATATSELDGMFPSNIEELFVRAAATLETGEVRQIAAFPTVRMDDPAHNAQVVYDQLYV